MFLFILPSDMISFHFMPCGEANLVLIIPACYFMHVNCMQFTEGKSGTWTPIHKFLVSTYAWTVGVLHLFQLLTLNTNTVAKTVIHMKKRANFPNLCICGYQNIVGWDLSTSPLTCEYAPSELVHLVAMLVRLSLGCHLNSTRHNRKSRNWIINQVTCTEHNKTHSLP